MVFDVEPGRQTELTQTRDDGGWRTDYELKFSGDMSFLKEEYSMRKICEMAETYNARATNRSSSDELLLLDHSMETGLMCVYLGGSIIAKDMSVRDTHLFVSGILAHRLREG